jgi:molybdopterin-guanine dinucleotide biosynthesis protein A
MLGIVFCGGKSLRMGTDKGLIPLQDKNWAQFAAEKLVATNIPVRISINSQQKERYKHCFAEELLLLDDELLGIGGPLLGLLSAHQTNPREDLLILACDLPLMTVELLERLQIEERESSGFEAIVFSINGAVEPLCAIYKSLGLRKIMDELRAKRLSRHSLKEVLGLLKVVELQVSHSEQVAFKNFNSHGLT